MNPSDPDRPPTTVVDELAVTLKRGVVLVVYPEELTARRFTVTGVVVELVERLLAVVTYPQTVTVVA